MSCEQLHETPPDELAPPAVRSLLCVSPLLCDSFLSRCECGCLSLVFSRRWPLLPRFVVGVICWETATDADALPMPAFGAGVWALPVPDWLPLGPLPPVELRFCCCVLRAFFPFELLVELLLSSAPEFVPPAPPPFCMSALTISCLASDVLVPGLVRLIFILSDW